MAIIAAIFLILILGGIIFYISLTKEKPESEGEKFKGESFTTQEESE